RHVGKREWKLNRRIRGRRLRHREEWRLQPVIRIARVKHAVKQTEARANRSLVIRERIVGNTDSGINVVERWIGCRRIVRRHPLAKWSVQQVELFMLNRLDLARRFISKSDVQGKLSSQP